MTFPLEIKQKHPKTVSVLNSGASAPLAPRGAACWHSNQFPPVAGFTLVELLVVISIIVILAGLLMPAINSTLNSAKKTTAKNQATQIATAITAYEAEYGRLPGSTTNSMDATLTATLCAGSNALAYTTNNPRAIIFLDSAAWEKGKGGTNSSGFCTPFGSNSVYSVALDTNYVNLITVPYQASSTTVSSSTNITKHIGVWTIWTNGTGASAPQYLIDSWE